LRALTWDHIDLHGEMAANPPVLRSISVWRSVRASTDTKTKRSRRTLAPMRCVVALRLRRIRQAEAKKLATHGDALHRGKMLKQRGSAPRLEEGRRPRLLPCPSLFQPPFGDAVTEN
jgi:hypothetical protein